MRELLSALLLTVLIEGLFVLLTRRSGKWLKFSLLGNVLTNPALNLAAMLIRSYAGPGVYAAGIAVLELLAAYTEEEIYYYGCGEGRKKSVITSLLANLLSFCTGLLLF